jgi:predicted kinase
MLIAMAGLPASGKSTLAEALASRLPVPAPVVSVDPIEAAMLRSGISRDQPTGLAAYFVAEAVADGILALGQTVIVDAVNAVEAARGQWRGLAERRGVRLVFLEVVCSDLGRHRRRLEGRSRGIEGLDEPTWESVEQRRREFEPWQGDRLVLDSMADHASNVQAALDHVLRP